MSGAPRPPIDVRPTAPTDDDTVVDVLARAFITDPVMRHLLPDDGARPANLRRFFAMVRRVETDPRDTLLATSGGEAGAATVWRKPGKTRTPVLAMLREFAPMLSVFGTALPRALRLQALIERHYPAAPHWYLEFAGCVPERQGRGLGGAAIRTRLAETDAAGVPTALETANEVNLGIYGALGYRVTGDFAVTPDLKFWSMWRDPA